MCIAWVEVGQRLQMVPSSEHFHPFSMQSVDPKTGDTEEMIKDISAMLLGGKDDFRETGAVEEKLHKVRVRWDTQSEDQFRNGWDRDGITGSEGDELAPLWGESTAC